MNRLWSIFTALQAGRELSNAEAWSHVKAATGHLMTILGVAVLFRPPEARPDDAQMLSIAGGIATIGGLLVGYLSYAADKRIGLPPVADPLDPPDIPRGD